MNVVNVKRREYGRLARENLCLCASLLSSGRPLFIVILTDVEEDRRRMDLCQGD